MPHRHCTIPSPLGPLRLVASGIGLCGLQMENEERHHPNSIEDHTRFTPIISQLNAYFSPAPSNNSTSPSTSTAPPSNS